jgi:hypothetical protein
MGVEQRLGSRAGLLGGIMKNLKSYFDSNSVQVLEEFFKSSHCTSGFNFDMYIGVLTSVQCCSEYCTDFAYAEIIVGNTGQGYLDFTDYDSMSPLRVANITIENELGELLFNKKISFVECFPQSKRAEQPSRAFADWCLGFHLIQQSIESSWFDDFDLLLEIPDLQEANEIVEECECLFALIEVFSDYELALEQHPNPEKLKAGVYQACGSVCEGIYTLHHIGLLLEEVKLELKQEGINDFDFVPAPETYVREQPKVGRNEPCPCGSGKKYKKCCG